MSPDTSLIPPISSPNIAASQIVQVIYPQHYLNAWTESHDCWYVYHTIWGHFNGILRKSLPSVYQHYNLSHKPSPVCIHPHLPLVHLVLNDEALEIIVPI
jgi:hypothetical protein